MHIPGDLPTEEFDGVFLFRTLTEIKFQNHIKPSLQLTTGAATKQMLNEL